MAGVRLGAGLLIALGVGAAGGGWWLPAGALLAGVLAWLAPPDAPGDAGTPRARALTEGVRFMAGLGVLPVFASAFAVYLLPEHRMLAAAGFVVVVTAAYAAGLRLPGTALLVLHGVLVVAAAGFVALCFAVPPERGAGSGPGPLGLFAAGAVLFPLFERTKRGVLPIAAAIVGAAALYQLGPLRLALSDAPVRDVLAAADGQSIQPLLGGVAVLVTAPAALRALTGTVGEKPDLALAALGGILAAAGAALLEPRQAVLLAGALALAEVLVRSLLKLSSKRDTRAVLAAVLSVSMLAWIPPAELLIAVVVLVLGVVVRLPVRTPRG